MSRTPAMSSDVLPKGGVLCVVGDVDVVVSLSDIEV